MDEIKVIIRIYFNEILYQNEQKHKQNAQKKVKPKDPNWDQYF